MGWSTWCTEDLCGLRDKCNQEEIRIRADALVTQGLDKLGYKWVFLDDCWAAKTRDVNGELQPDPTQFPDGMKNLVDYVHERGLYLAIYTCIGTQTCKKGRPGSYGHFDIDAQTFAGWGVDMVKCDNCNRPANETIRDLFTQFSVSLNATGREMLFALCEWGQDNVSSWGGDVGQMFRIQMDHLPFFNWPPSAAGEGYGCGTAEIVNYMADLHPSTFSGPGRWADPDFLMTLFLGDKVSMDYIESRTEFTFWVLWAAPLLVATDVANLNDEKKSILMNTEVLAVHKDPLWRAGERLFNTSDGGQVWSRPLENGDLAVVLYNAITISPTAINVAVSWEQLGWNATDQVLVRDLWARADLGSFSHGFNRTIEPHDVLFLRVQRPCAM